ncbi:hypothetical protein Tco_0956172 [Tanacetum coccineum]|uniref:Uncharacterized protein n=1 Tax=Tanacetum coccineum TaxID=301880 RepID=A0ABQ5EA43_9ASTR
MTLSETFQVAAIIEKLPPSWVEFKNYLKHKRKEMSVEDLVVRLGIEEDNSWLRKTLIHLILHRLIWYEHVGHLPGCKQKFQGTCYNYDQRGHRAANLQDAERLTLVERLTWTEAVYGQSLQLLISRGEGDIRKNLVSDWLLNKFGFRLVFESDKFVLSKNQMYVGKGLLCMLCLNLMYMETGSSSRIDDKVVQDQRQRDDNDLQDERQD